MHFTNSKPLILRSLFEKARNFQRNFSLKLAPLHQAFFSLAFVSAHFIVKLLAKTKDPRTSGLESKYLENLRLKTNLASVSLRSLG